MDWMDCYGGGAEDDVDGELGLAMLVWIFW